MNNKYNIVVIILIFIIFLVTFYSLHLINKNATWLWDQSKDFEIIENKEEEIITSKNKSVIYKNNFIRKTKEEKPYLWIDNDSLKKYDCASIKNSQNKNECNSLKEVAIINSYFLKLNHNEIINFDCNKIKETNLISKCESQIDFIQNPYILKN